MESESESDAAIDGEGEDENEDEDESVPALQKGNLNFMVADEKIPGNL